MDDRPSFSTVIKNPGFTNLWLNQILVQLSYNSLNFALIIWVFKLTDSNTAVSALLFAVYLPAVLFGLFAGVIVDVTDRKKIILGIDLILCILFLLMPFIKSSYPLILILTFLINSIRVLSHPPPSQKKPTPPSQLTLFHHTFYDLLSRLWLSRSLNS